MKFLILTTFLTLCSFQLFAVEQSFEFNLGKKSLQFVISNNRVQSFSISGERAYLTIEDKIKLKTLRDQSSQDPITTRVRVVNMIIELFPVDEEIGNYLNLFSGNEKEKDWTSICHRMGKNNFGKYYAYGRLKTGTAVVGDLATGCYGRCGGQCGDNGGKGRYTQECFNHDLCHRIEGMQLGECSSEFWKAASGYLAAPKCL